jgi:hypothetical protein
MGNRVHCSILFDEVQHGESIALKIWRDNEALDIELPLYVNREDRISGNQYEPPPYLIVGGLVFTELSTNYLGSLGRNWRDKTSPELLYELIYRNRLGEEAAREKPIVMSKILKHPSNVDFAVGPRSILKKLNGREVTGMRDLQSILESTDDEFYRFRFLSGAEEALNRTDAEAANQELMQQYNIPSAQRL